MTIYSWIGPVERRTAVRPYQINFMFHGFSWVPFPKSCKSQDHCHVMQIYLKRLVVHGMSGYIFIKIEQLLLSRKEAWQCVAKKCRVSKPTMN